MSKHRRAPGDTDFRGRFKVIAQCHNLEELNLPSFIANYSESIAVGWLIETAARPKPSP